MNKKITLILSLVLLTFVPIFAQQNSASKNQFDDLWNKIDQENKSKNVSTKDLNAAEQEKIKQMDAKQQTITNKNYKGIDTSDLDKLSTKPIVKGASDKKNIEAPREAKIILPSKSTEKVTTPVKPSKEAVAPVKETPATTKETLPTKNSTTIKKEPVINIEKEKNVVKEKIKEDYSTQPIIKNKPSTIETKPAPKTTVTKPAKYNIDTTKSIKDFTFDTKPIVNGNASYYRQNEPLPKTKEQIENEIPVNRKPNNTNYKNVDPSVKQAYAQYNKEADSLNSANKRRLDSIMQALNISLPTVVSPTDYIDIFVSGGGTLKDNNSKIYDRISILHSGVIQREYKTKADGVQRVEKKISKDELTKLAQYIADMSYFDFKHEYDCEDDNTSCNQRFGKQPSLVPLELNVTIGEKSNKVKVSIFAPETEQNLVNYPTQLEKIMKAIYTVVEKQ